jgi:hypothetical protein
VDGARRLGNGPGVQQAQSNLKRVASQGIDAANSKIGTTQNTAARVRARPASPPNATP